MAKGVPKDVLNLLKDRDYMVRWAAINDLQEKWAWRNNVPSDSRFIEIIKEIKEGTRGYDKGTRLPKLSGKLYKEIVKEAEWWVSEDEDCPSCGKPLKKSTDRGYYLCVNPACALTPHGRAEVHTALRLEELDEKAENYTDKGYEMSDKIAVTPKCPLCGRDLSFIGNEKDGTLRGQCHACHKLFITMSAAIRKKSEEEHIFGIEKGPEKYPDDYTDDKRVVIGEKICPECLKKDGVRQGMSTLTYADRTMVACNRCRNIYRWLPGASGMKARCPYCHEDLDNVKNLGGAEKEGTCLNKECPRYGTRFVFDTGNLPNFISKGMLSPGAISELESRKREREERKIQKARERAIKIEERKMEEAAEKGRKIAERTAR